MAMDDTWAPLQYEEHEYRPDTEFGLSRRERQSIMLPYKAAVVPAIAQLESVPLSLEIQALTSEATGEIARFDAEVGREIAPFASILLRSESAASSQIEHLSASARAIAFAELGDDDGENARSIVSNVRAMTAAIRLAERLDGEAIIAMHAVLLESEHPEWTGHWRDEQVWVGGNIPQLARYVAPHHDRVPAAMDDLVEFLARDDIPVLIQAAIAHAQFETIHPFPDGNGRVGRALIHSLLRSKELTQWVTVPVSAGLLIDTESYFDALTAYRAGDPSLIVERMADATFAAIGNGRILVNELRATKEEWRNKVIARSDSSVWPLMDLIVRQPVIDSATVQRELELSDRNALLAIDRLVDAGILREVRGKRRNRRWESTAVLVALDAFARRAGRRG